MTFLRAGKRAGFMAEKLGIKQIFIKGSAVERNEGALPARRKVVQLPGNQLLAGAAFPYHKHGFLQPGEARHLLKDFQKIIRLTQQRVMSEGNWT